jgi:nucleoside-triphosphatase
MEKPPKDSLILMDEIGFMESKAEVFCKAILKLLDGDIPVIAAVKEKNTPFLDQVKSHPNCRVFYIREDNRNELFEEVLAFLQKQL